MVKDTSGHHDKRVFLIRKLHRRSVGSRTEISQSSGKFAHMHDRSSRVILRWTRPLKPLSGYLLAVQSPMADPAEGRSNRSDLVHNLSRGKVRLLIAHTVHDLSKDPCIRLCLSLNLHSLSHTLYPALRIGKGSLFFRIRAAWKDHVCQLCSLCHKELVYHKEIQGL